MENSKFIEYFQKVPIAINNLYGDPFFALQEKNTFEKLNSLVKIHHKGPVALITKSEVEPNAIERLEGYAKRLKLVVLVSISGLLSIVEEGKPYELTPGDRFKTLERCADKGIPAIAYVRPFIPGYNTSAEQIDKLFSDIAKTGVKTAVVSGLRGDDEILSRNGVSEEERKEWSFRVKTIPKSVRAALNEASQKYGIHIFDRTSCGVAYVLGLGHSWNPYYSSPQLAGCMKCPLKSTCYDLRDTDIFKPTEDDIELCQMLGYDAKARIVDKGEMCSVNPVDRGMCKSCCTSCYMLYRNAIELNPDDHITLGDTGLLRMLTGKLVCADQVHETGDLRESYPTSDLLDEENIYIVNSWWAFARSINYCFGCSYCLIKLYYASEIGEQEIGANPVEIAEKLWEKLNAN